MLFNVDFTIVKYQLMVGIPLPNFYSSSTMTINSATSLKLIFIASIVIHIQANAVKREAETCKTNAGENGQCKEVKDCPDALKDIKNNNKPTICRFEGKNPIICCQLTKTVNRQSDGSISNQKCADWYATRLQSFHNFVSGGMDASAKEFPHMAALGYGDKSHITWNCGGSLISERFVLTAAHCITPKDLGKVKYVRLGDLNLITNSDDAQPQNFEIGQTYKHPDFVSKYNDIALIQLDKPALFNEYVKPACLQTLKTITPTNWIVTGWGWLEDGDPSDILQKANLTAYSYDNCKEKYKISVYLSKGILEDLHICAYGNYTDTCKGDSGGPLQTKHEKYENAFTIIGVTSFGKSCGIADSVGVYVRVSNYIEWIESIVWPI